ncbi:acyl-CoA dehydrogenase family protein [Microbacterium sp. SORGH_AS_0888]|uniref:acyl-CoA dehydrogenase family protein n=1 Tax=Microbacterium sp. SORGH_AS_0888 TaxID=3041791 RepID=UPI00277DAA69|nr:acyl-CoA dehydrogenase family protein [Microbacterium sp. SORGH_AS_0888]MDQ1130313.1 alkylation response protein AidB-like acyl-CoA dehydrogenase [Microbacterium sp. SORGH_AS_0888]
MSPDDDLRLALARAVETGAAAPLPGEDTAALWRLLAETAREDVALARVLEPHLDALAILAQARTAGVDADGALRAVDAGPDATWGVFAAEGGDRPLRAEADGGAWRLTGVKPWCSLAGVLSHALVTAWVGEDRGLFAIDLRRPEVTAADGPWHARGLPRVVSAPIELRGAPAAPIGEPGWYLRRPGFSWGGMSVAAVWWGGAAPVVDALRRAAEREGADQVSQVAAGTADALHWSAGLALDHAAARVDAGATGAEARLLAARTRAVVADAVRRILELERRALGPGPVVSDEAHARRVADLELYVRQDHGDRDLARLARIAGSDAA